MNKYKIGDLVNYQGEEKEVKALASYIEEENPGVIKFKYLLVGLIGYVKEEDLNVE